MSESLNSALVIDNGSSSCKAGLAGDMAPRVFYPSNDVRLLHQRMEDGESGNVRYRFMGQERPLQSKLVAPTVNEHPIKNGVVTNWDDMETILRDFYNTLDVTSRMEELPVVMTEAPLNPKINREKMAEILFERFHIPSVFFAIPAVMSLFATGRQNGIVIDCGHDVSHVVSVCDGMAVENTIFRVELGGNDVNRYLSTKLMERGCTSVTNELAKDIKEKVCRTAINFEDEMKSAKDALYELPDGSRITVSKEDQLFPPEGLFRPYLLDKDVEGLPEIIHRSLSKCDVVVRAQLYANTVICGGSSLFPGFAERFDNEMRSLAPCKAKINIVAKAERHHSAWLGGSMLAAVSGNNSALKRMFISRDEYQEVGPSITRRK